MGSFENIESSLSPQQQLERETKRLSSLQRQFSDLAANIDPTEKKELAEAIEECEATISELEQRITSLSPENSDTEVTGPHQAPQDPHTVAMKP
jgi:predicted nuclease with TOPRIM domain